LYCSPRPVVISHIVSAFAASVQRAAQDALPQIRKVLYTANATESPNFSGRNVGRADRFPIAAMPSRNAR
jgi:hypothetical protein